MYTTVQHYSDVGKNGKKKSKVQAQQEQETKELRCYLRPSFTGRSSTPSADPRPQALWDR